MILNSMLVFLALSFSIFICAIILLVLLNKDIKLWQAIKLICICGALNKFLLTGSGYLAISRGLKINGLPFYKSLSAFAIFELFSILPWLICGLYFGAKVAIEIPSVLIIFLAIVLFFIIFKKENTQRFLKNALNYVKESKFNIPKILPLVLINAILGVAYYFFLLRCFSVEFSILELFKIVTVAFTVGYLSPAPAGLGFKEGSLVFLLMQKGLLLKDSMAIAVVDRVIATGFYAVLGFLFGARIIKDEIGKRFNNFKR